MNYSVNEDQLEIIITDLAYEGFPTLVPIKNIKKNEVILDARSATFFALGRSNVLRKPCVLIINKKEIANALSGVTEARYQSVPLIIVALGNQNETNRINRSYQSLIQESISLKIDSKHSLEDEIDKIATKVSINKFFRPILVHVDVQEENNDILKTNEFEEIIDSILNNCDLDFKIHVPAEVLRYLSIKYKNVINNFISIDSAYGNISKFLGHSLISKDKCFLVTTFNNIIRDINSLRLDYISNNITIICVSNEYDAYDFEMFTINHGFQFKKISEARGIKDILTERFNKPIFVNYLSEGGR